MNIQSETASVIEKQYGIAIEVISTLFDDGLLTEHQSRKFLIRHEYLCNASKLGLTQLRSDLAEKYFVSVSTVEKYTAGI